MLTPVNLNDKLNKFSEHWSPKIIARLNDYHLKVVKIKGDFTWHNHKDTDEVFLVLKGEMRIDFRDGSVDLKEGELLVVPKRKEHKPFAENECSVLLVEPAGTHNTGDETNNLTAEDNIWIQLTE